MPRPFLMYPDKRLRMVAAPIDAVTDETRELWDEMLAAMYAMPGVGLAATQIGVLQRVIVADCSDRRDQPVRMANPVVLHASGQMREHEEGSPNLPGHWARVSRPRAVTLEYLDETGAQQQRDFVGLWATSVQHQIDHLEGRLFIDHLSPVKRKMIVARHLKALKKGRK